MSRVLAFAPVACLAVVLAVPPAAPAQQPPARPAKAEDELVDRVRKAIDNGVKYLKSQQSPKGNWEGIVVNMLADMEGGQTALVTLALLNCGVSPADPKLAKALEYLEKLPPKKTYVVGLQNLVFAETREKKYLPMIQKNADWLIEKAINYNGGAGRLDGWSYPGNEIADNSNTQYALLGLYAAKQAGARIDDKVWKAVQDYYARTQLTDPGAPTAGYWTYYNGQFGAQDKASISMSVAGVCGLVIASMGLDESEQGLDPKTGVAANCGVYSENSALAKGMNWVGANFTFQSPKSTFYNFYGIERLGRVSGRRFLGRDIDWYREGCQQLVGKYDPTARVWRGGMQKDDGSFLTESKSVDGQPLLATSFAMLFLSKGRTPVLVSKLAWGDFQERGAGGGTFVEVPNRGDRPGTVNWNRKHNDTRNVVEFCARELFNNAPLSWQVYDPRRRTLPTEDAIREEVGGLLQSPVLYLNGHGRITFLTDFAAADLSATEKIIKLYLEEGGFLVAEACCGDREFAADFRKLMKRLFPGNTLAPLPPAHPIRTIIPGLTPEDFPELEYLDRGCRTVALFSPVPLAGYWEEARYAPKDAKHPQNRGEKAFCLARNVVAYATGMELPKPKLTRTNLVKGTEQGVTRSHFKPAQLEVGDKPAPDALKNLMGFLRDNARLEVAVNTAVLPPGDEQLHNFKFMYLHGRKPLNLSDGEIENLQSNLQTGGLLFADAACNGYQQWKEFDKSFRETCKRLFPDQPLVPIQLRTADGKEDPLFRIAREAGIDINSVKCRRELPDDKGPEPGEPRPQPLHLEGIKIDGRWVVIYSKYDVGCAIEGHKAADCLGHDKDSALRIASAVVLYSLKR